MQEDDMSVIKRKNDRKRNKTGDLKKYFRHLKVLIDAKIFKTLKIQDAIQKL